MLGDIREHLERQPFVPFAMIMADDRKIRMATRDPIAISQTRTIVMHDDVLASLLMSGLTVDKPAPQSEQA